VQPRRGERGECESWRSDAAGRDPAPRGEAGGEVGELVALSGARQPLLVPDAVASDPRKSDRCGEPDVWLSCGCAPLRASTTGFANVDSAGEGSPSSFAPEVGKIVGMLNPTHRGAQDWNSTEYEGIFIGAQDSRGHPFLYGYNFVRARGGGRWARSPNLYPFLHG
jgi:hypothetical protein